MDVPVATVAEVTAAIAAAQPGDRIVLADGNYAFTSSPSCSAAGTAQAPIEVVAKNPLGAKITFDATEGFKVTGPHWHFDGLDIRGVCASDDTCEHAFHVTGAAKSFRLRRSRLVDFNAQVKVNADQIGGTWVTPDDGLIEGNELFDTRARSTSKPTTKLNIDTGDRFVVRANYIHDYQKGGGDGVSYAAFMKSGGKDGVFERNLVVCAKDFTGGTRIGLSFGGGGTAPEFCAPAYSAGTPCDPEHSNGTMRNNVIASCSDVGIYLNKATGTKVLFNTLIATSGIDFRYASSTGEAVGNVLSGKINARELGAFTGTTNLESFTGFTGMYVAPLEGDLRHNGDLSAVLGKAAARADVLDDYCARARPSGGPYDLGALQSSLGNCTTVPPPLGGAAGADAGAGPGSSSGGPGSGDGGAPPPIGGVGDNDVSSPARDDGGCGCRVAVGSKAAPALFVALLALAAASRRRRGPRG